jgi:4-hydroxybenzoate polyprenyltransferase
MSRTRIWLRALRAHQWAKNLLVFAPLALGGAAALKIPAILSVIGLFVCMSALASGTYLINDLADLRSDRRHRSKKHRPLASGAISVRAGAFVALALIMAGLIGSVLISRTAAAGLMAYLLLTLAYSMRFKRSPILDVTVLGVLYSLRLLIGAAAAQTTASVWLLTFALFFFVSLSLAKRHSEIVAAKASAQTILPGRGYLVEDGPVTLGLGISAAVASVLIVVLYLTDEAFPSGVYAHPVFLWAVPLMLHLWVSRIWLLAHRGQMDDDPVAFAVRDRTSLLVAALLALALLAALT